METFRLDVTLGNVRQLRSRSRVTSIDRSIGRKLRSLLLNSFAELSVKARGYRPETRALDRDAAHRAKLLTSN
jgi:hypothetical protein